MNNDNPALDIVADQIYHPCPDVVAYSLEGQQLDIISVDLDVNGKIVFLHTSSGETICAEDVLIYQNFLHVPGVGDIKSGTEVKLEGDDTSYTLLYGWHTNISNQTILTWFLRPIKEYSNVSDESANYMSHYPRDLSQDRTVYADIVNKIWLVTP